MQKVFRVMFYLFGTVLMAFSFELNIKSNLGVGPIMTVSYTISKLSSIDLFLMTMLLYAVFLAGELIIRRQKILLKNIMQLLVSILFTQLMKLFDSVITVSPNTILEKLLLLIIAIILAGLGISFMLNMRLLPFPSEALVQAIADVSHKNVGLVKNCFDFSCVLCAVIIGLLFGHRLYGIGIGTLLTTIGTGRFVALSNFLFQKKLCRIAGINRE